MASLCAAAVECSSANWEDGMVLFDDEPVRIPIGHRIGEDLSTLSLHELEERITVLQTEITRLQEATVRKSASMSAASAFFKTKE
jgi:uncharacterized small protein (DUF1192 family)